MSSAGSHEPVHGLSFDIEDWFHVIGVPELEDSTTWEDRESLVERRTDQILQICDDHGARATFFVVGWIADRHPELMRRIAEAGHEFGSHTHWLSGRVETGECTWQYSSSIQAPRFSNT